MSNEKNWELWKITIQCHPKENIDGIHSFDNLLDIETFVSDNDVLKDHIISVERMTEEKTITYICLEILYPQSVQSPLKRCAEVRLILSQQRVEYFF